MHPYFLEFEVRDNEIDMQGVVNNANYYNYFAHTRHKYIKEVLNISFTEMTAAKQMLFLVSSQIDFKRALLPEEKFMVTCQLVPYKGVRFAFQQEIKKVDTQIIAATSLNIAVCLDGNNRNRPYLPEVIKAVLAKTHTQKK